MTHRQIPRLGPPGEGQRDRHGGMPAEAIVRCRTLDQHESTLTNTFRLKTNRTLTTIVRQLLTTTSNNSQGTERGRRRGQCA